jgi:protein SSD1
MPRIVWFKATDKRVPLIAIPTEQTPDDFVENSQKYATTLFVVGNHREKAFERL